MVFLCLLFVLPFSGFFPQFSGLNVDSMTEIGIKRSVKQPPAFFFVTSHIHAVTLPGESRAGRSCGHGGLHGDDGRRVTNGAVRYEASALPICVDCHCGLKKQEMGLKINT